MTVFLSEKAQKTIDSRRMSANSDRMLIFFLPNRVATRSHHRAARPPHRIEPIQSDLSSTIAGPFYARGVAHARRSRHICDADTSANKAAAAAMNTTLCRRKPGPTIARLPQIKRTARLGQKKLQPQRRCAAFVS